MTWAGERGRRQNPALIRTINLSTDQNLREATCGAFLVKVLGIGNDGPPQGIT